MHEGRSFRKALTNCIFPSRMKVARHAAELVVGCYSFALEMGGKIMAVFLYQLNDRGQMDFLVLY